MIRELNIKLQFLWTLCVLATISLGFASNKSTNPDDLTPLCTISCYYLFSTGDEFI